MHPEFRGYGVPHGTFCISNEESITQRNLAPSTAQFCAHLHHDNIICLPGQPKDGSPSAPSLAEGMGYMMVTYSDLFTFVIMLCAVITLVCNFKHKK